MVAADSDAGLVQALAAGADALVVDLGGPGPSARRSASRRRAADFVAANRDAASLFVRVGDLSSGLAAADLDAVVPTRPRGIVLPKSTGGADVRLSAMLRPREAAAGMDDGALAVIAMGGDTPLGLFGLGTYRGASARLVGIAWDIDALAAELGCPAEMDSDMARLARTLTRAGAAAASVAAIDTHFPGARTRLAPDAARARTDGFTGKFARDPKHVPVINWAFARAASNK